MAKPGTKRRTSKRKKKQTIPKEVVEVSDHLNDPDYEIQIQVKVRIMK